MQTLRLFILGVLLNLALAGPVLAAAPVGSVPGPDVEDGVKVAAWIKERLKKAKAGERELMRVPLVRRSKGWGCRCPGYFIGRDTGAHNGGNTWVRPIFGAMAEEPKGKEDTGWVMVAEGYFTGKRVEEDLRDDEDAPKEWLYNLSEFQVLRLRRLHGTEVASDGSDGQVYVILAGPEAKKKVAPLADGKPWLVIAQDFPLFEETSAQRATALKERLVAAGFPQAEILDSRQAPRLFCCFRVVVAGRAANKEEAKRLADAAKQKRFDSYIRQGF